MRERHHDRSEGVEGLLMSKSKPIETIYNGYRFRSRLEARWAVFFDNIGIQYEYEPEGLMVLNGQWYLPDFYLTQFHCYFEVKRAPEKIDRGSLPYDEFSEAIEKIGYGSYTDSWAGIIAFGDPYDHYMWIFCQDISDNSAGSYDSPCVFGLYGNSPILVSWDDWRDRRYVTSFDTCEDIPMFPGPSDGSNPYLTEKLIEAELKARQARFEHGETPIKGR